MKTHSPRKRQLFTTIASGVIIWAVVSGTIIYPQATLADSVTSSVRPLAFSESARGMITARQIEEWARLRVLQQIPPVAIDPHRQVGNIDGQEMMRQWLQGEIRPMVAEFVRILGRLPEAAQEVQIFDAAAQELRGDKDSRWGLARVRDERFERIRQEAYLIASERITRALMSGVDRGDISAAVQALTPVVITYDQLFKRLPRIAEVREALPADAIAAAARGDTEAVVDPARQFIYRLKSVELARKLERARRINQGTDIGNYAESVLLPLVSSFYEIIGRPPSLREANNFLLWRVVEGEAGRGTDASSFILQGAARQIIRDAFGLPNDWQSREVAQAALVIMPIVIKIYQVVGRLPRAEEIKRILGVHAEFLRQGHFAIEADNIAALAYDMAAVELGGQPMADGTQVGGQFTKTELLSMARAFDVTLGRRPNMNEVERAATELKALVARQGRAPVNTDAFFGGFVAQQLVRQMPAHALVLAYTLPDRESVTTMAGTI